MLKNLKNIIREEINDFEWIGNNPFEVGNCFLITDEPMENITNAFFRGVFGYYLRYTYSNDGDVTRRHYKNIIKINNTTFIDGTPSGLSFKPFVHPPDNEIFGDGSSVHTTRDSGFIVPLSKVEKWLEQGYIMPTNCLDI